MQAMMAGLSREPLRPGDNALTLAHIPAEVHAEARQILHELDESMAKADSKPTPTRSMPFKSRMEKAATTYPLSVQYACAVDAAPRDLRWEVAGIATLLENKVIRKPIGLDDALQLFYSGRLEDASLYNWEQLGKAYSDHWKLCKRHNLSRNWHVPENVVVDPICQAFLRTQLQLAHWRPSEADPSTSVAFLCGQPIALPAACPHGFYLVLGVIKAGMGNKRKPKPRIYFPISAEVESMTHLELPRNTAALFSDSTFEESGLNAFLSLRHSGYDLVHFRSIGGLEETAFAREIRKATFARVDLLLLSPNGNRASRLCEPSVPHWVPETAAELASLAKERCRSACFFVGDAHLWENIPNRTVFDLVVSAFQQALRTCGCAVVTSPQQRPSDEFIANVLGSRYRNQQPIVCKEDGNHWYPSDFFNIRRLIHLLTAKASCTDNIIIEQPANDPWTAAAWDATRRAPAPTSSRLVHEARPVPWLQQTPRADHIALPTQVSSPETTSHIINQQPAHDSWTAAAWDTTRRALAPTTPRLVHEARPVPRPQQTPKADPTALPTQVSSPETTSLPKSSWGTAINLAPNINNSSGGDAAAGLSPSPPSVDWQEHIYTTISVQSIPYYFNNFTQESTWSKPAELFIPAPHNLPVPAHQQQPVQEALPKSLHRPVPAPLQPVLETLAKSVPQPVPAPLQPVQETLPMSYPQPVPALRQPVQEALATSLHQPVADLDWELAVDSLQHCGSPHPVQDALAKSLPKHMPVSRAIHSVQEARPMSVLEAVPAPQHQLEALGMSVPKQMPTSHALQPVQEALGMTSPHITRAATYPEAEERISLELAMAESRPSDVPSPPSVDWQEHIYTTTEGQSIPYYFNSCTQESTWSKPAAPIIPAPAGWTASSQQPVAASGAYPGAAWGEEKELSALEAWQPGDVWHWGINLLCTKCNRVKPLNEFYKKQQGYNLQATRRCKLCNFI
ncbi:hypothetical protein N9L19_00910 [bacterium]|nr:hypothetical protein [bacterium]